MLLELGVDSVVTCPLVSEGKLGISRCDWNEAIRLIREENGVRKVVGEGHLGKVRFRG